MALTRRDIHKGFAALLATAFSGRVAMAATAENSADEVFLNRLTFGATPDARAELAALGQNAWLENQLAMPAHSDDIQARLAKVRFWIEYEEGETEDDDGEILSWPAVEESRPLQWIDATSEELVQLLDWYRPIPYTERERPIREVRVVALLRAVHAPAQLREIMTEFWLNHFSVNAVKDEVTSALFPVYDRDMRANALGNFRDLLLASATSPVMLHYLNNDESAGSPANENYARELLELHTLGQDAYFNDVYENWRDVPGAVAGLAEGYIDDDVYEVARALTGWSIGDGREFGDNSRTPMTGKLSYIASWHDPYQKRVLGVELDANTGPMEDGRRVLDILANHPATARFVSAKMIRRLGIEAPSDAYKAKIAAVFMAERDSPDQIAQVIRAIVADPEFTATKPDKLRRPFEFLAAYLRATGAEVTPRHDELFWYLGEMGWHQHAVPPPTGHSDHTADWADTRTISGLLTLAIDAHAESMGVADDVLMRANPGVTNMGELGQYWANRFGLPPNALAPALAGLDFVASDEVPLDDPDWYEWVNTLMVAYAAFNPAFLYR